jgi:3-hydroxybutyryl-CoA dehydrogenase
MKILARGSKQQAKELAEKLQNTEHLLDIADENQVLANQINAYDLFFDLTFDEEPGRILEYNGVQIPMVLSAVKIQLAQVFKQFSVLIDAPIFGFNALPSFINRSLAEISCYHLKHKNELDSIFKSLNWNYKIVQDRVGMFTPRVICMIINEACYTLQEGTASMEDIDTSMKLGTGYPHGPFEWADLIGIKNVYEVLDALYTDTREERYKICPLLKTHYLMATKFYSNEGKN